MKKRMKLIIIQTIKFHINHLLRQIKIIISKTLKNKFNPVSNKGQNRVIWPSLKVQKVKSIYALIIFIIVKGIVYPGAKPKKPNELLKINKMRSINFEGEAEVKIHSIASKLKKK